MNHKNQMEIGRIEKRFAEIAARRSEIVELIYPFQKNVYRLGLELMISDNSVMDTIKKMYSKSYKVVITEEETGRVFIDGFFNLCWRLAQGNTEYIGRNRKGL